MILTGNQIEKEVKKNRINIQPFNLDQLTTNSYDVILGEKLLYYTDKILDPSKKPNFKEVIIPPEGFILEKGSFYLGSTQEIVGSDYYVPILHAKSGIARLGLFVHVTADLIDIGSHGNITLQLYATLPVRIFANKPIAQVSFWVPKGKRELYSGKYQGSEGPQISQVHRDWGMAAE